MKAQVLANSEGVATEYVLQFAFQASNNQAKYEVLLVGLRIAKKFKVKNLRTFTDFQLIVNQIKKKSEAQDSIMVKYLEKVQTLIPEFKFFKISHVP